MSYFTMIGETRTEMLVSAQDFIDQHWHHTEQRLQRACDEMESLLGFLQFLEAKLRMAQNFGTPLSIVQIRMRIQLVQAVYNLYHEYAGRKAEKLEDVWQQLKQAGFTEDQLKTLSAS